MKKFNIFAKKEKKAEKICEISEKKEELFEKVSRVERDFGKMAAFFVLSSSEIPEQNADKAREMFRSYAADIVSGNRMDEIGRVLKICNEKSCPTYDKNTGVFFEAAKEMIIEFTPNIDPRYNPALI